VKAFLQSAYKALGSGAAAAVPTAILVSEGGFTLVDWLLVAGSFLAGAGFTYALPANKARV
jgi:hypothetical protein